MNLAEIYLKDADVIRINGHYKGEYFGCVENGVGIVRSPAESPVCALGALSIAIDGQPVPQSNELDDAAVDFARRIVARPAEEPILSIAYWNDADDRTADNVIAAFEQAAREVAA